MISIMTLIAGYFIGIGTYMSYLNRKKKTKDRYLQSHLSIGTKLHISYGYGIGNNYSCIVMNTPAEGDKTVDLKFEDESMASYSIKDITSDKFIITDYIACQVKKN